MMLRFGIPASLLLLLLLGLAQGQLQDAASSTNYLRSQNENQNENENQEPRLLASKGMAELAVKTVPFAIQVNIATSTNGRPSLGDYKGVATAIESWFDGNSKKFYAQKQNVDSSYNNNSNNNPTATAVPFLYAATSCRVGNEEDYEDDTAYMAFTVYNPNANDGFQHKVRLQCLVDFYIASSIDSINDRGSDYARASAAVPSTAELIDNAVKSYSMMGFVTNTFIPAVPTASGSVFQSTQDVKYRMMGDMVVPFSVPVPTSSTSTSTSTSSSSSEPPASAPTSTSTSTSTSTCITCSTTATASTTTGTSTVTATASITPPPASAPTSTTISASTTTTTTTTITQLGRASDSDSDVIPCPPSNSNLRTPTRPPSVDTQTVIAARQGTTSTGNRVVNIKAILKWEIAIGKNNNRQPTAAEYTVFLNKQKAYLSKLFRDHYNNNANTPTFVSATSSYVSKEYKPVTTTTTHTTKALVMDDTADTMDLRYHSGGATNAPRYSHIMVIQNTLKFRLKAGQSDPPMYQWVGVMRNSDPTDFRVDYLQPTSGLWKQMGALQWTVLDQ